MLRIILLTLAAAVLLAAILVWMGVISWGGGGQVEVNPVRVESGTVNVTLPTVEAVPANGAQPR